MTEDEFQRAKAKVRERYDGWVLGSIKRTYEATKDGADDSSPLAAFILTSCAIDFLAGFYCGIESFTGGQSSNNYKAFVAEYMPQYEPVDVYAHIRCRLAHNYTIGGDLHLTHNNRSIHYPREYPQAKIINFENFLEDFEAAAEAYFDALDGSLELRENFEKRVKLGLVDAGPLQLSQESTSASPTSGLPEKPRYEMYPLLLRSWSESLATLRTPIKAVFIFLLFTLLTTAGQWLVLTPNEFGANIKTLAIAVGAMVLIFTVIFALHLDSTGFFRVVLAQNLPSLKEGCIVSILYVDTAAKPDAAVIKSSFEMAGYGPMEISRTVSNQHRPVTIESSDSELLRGVGRAFQFAGVGATMRFMESPQILLQIVVENRIGY